MRERFTPALELCKTSPEVSHDLMGCCCLARCFRVNLIVVQWPGDHPLPPLLNPNIDDQLEIFAHLSKKLNGVAQATQKLRASQRFLPHVQENPEP
jgi:hypothetical protein